MVLFPRLVLFSKMTMQDMPDFIYSFIYFENSG